MCFVFIFVMRLVRKFLMLPLLLVDHILSSFVFFSAVLFVPFTRSEYYTHLFMLKRLNEKAVLSLLWLMSKRLKKTQRKNGKRGGVQVLKTKRSIQAGISFVIRSFRLSIVRLTDISYKNHINTVEGTMKRGNK